MTQSPTLPPTPGQTVGPFYGFALPYAGGNELVPPGRPDAIRLHGTVRDGRGDPVPDALIEVWQADEHGRVSREPGSLQRDGFTFTGWGRTSVDRTGEYSFTTVVPGPTEGAAPFFAITVFARGLLNRLFTRAYVPGHPLLETDRLLASVPADRRGSLVARRDATGLVFDIRLQGEGETVFLSYPGHDG
jgi:protocatechuate 3,4-dioxygenase alpha subunit